MRILTGGDVRTAVSMREAIDAVREGFIALSDGRARVPLRSVVEMPGGPLLTMPAAVEGTPIGAVKIVSVCPSNAAAGLPTIHAVVLVVDAATGAPLALMDGAAVTAQRTGAASGLATELLALPDASVLAVIGAGAQARTQIAAVRAVRPIAEIRIFSLSGVDALARELCEQGHARVTAASSSSEALQGAQVVVAATNSRTPVVRLSDLAPGAHVNGIGSFTPEMQEIAADVVQAATLVVDHRASAWTEAGDLIIPRDQGLIDEAHVYAEIGEIAAGQKPGRQSREEITFFKSVGNAVQDVMLAARVWKAAQARGLGTDVDL